MVIAGYQPNSFVDYPGKIAFMVFLQGCNMNCFFCHNRQLIKKTVSVMYSSKLLLGEIEKRKEFIDAVVVSGGEATLHKGLDEFFYEVKKLGLLTKLDTNGLKPDVVEYLIKAGSLDYIAMDIKAPFSKYKEISGVDINLENLKRSIQIIINSKIEHEFRTTFVPQLNLEDITEIMSYIGGAKRYVLQEYKPVSYDYYFDKKLDVLLHSKVYLEEVRDMIKEVFGR